MQLHLFSSVGEDPLLGNVLEAARLILAGRAAPTVLYLPAASTDRHFVRETRAAFHGLARVVAVKFDDFVDEPRRRQSATRLRSALRSASLLYIPGGNTYVMAQRLHAAGVMEDLRRAVGGGLPYIGVSAGAVLCGPDILTTNDINACGCTTFSGLGLIPFSLNVHFPAGEESALEREDRLREYLRFHDRLILALCEDACVRVTDGAVEAVRGTVWKLERGVERVCLPGGALCPKIP